MTGCTFREKAIVVLVSSAILFFGTLIHLGNMVRKDRAEQELRKETAAALSMRIGELIGELEDEIKRLRSGAFLALTPGMPPR